MINIQCGRCVQSDVKNWAWNASLAMEFSYTYRQNCFQSTFNDYI